MRISTLFKHNVKAVFLLMSSMLFVFVDSTSAQDVVAIDSGNWFADSSTIWDLEEDGIPDGVEPQDGNRIHIGEDLFQGITVTLDADLIGSYDIRIKEKSRLIIPNGITLDTSNRLRPDDVASVIEQRGNVTAASIRIDDDDAAYIISGGSLVVNGQIRVDEGSFIVDSSGPGEITEIFIEEYITSRGNGDTTTKFIAGTNGVTPIDAGFITLDSTDGQNLVVDISAYDQSNGDLVLFKGGFFGEFTSVTIIGGTADVDYEADGGNAIALTNFGPDPSGPPVITAQSPADGSTVFGNITHIDVTFDEFVIGIEAGNLRVNGSPATSVSDLSILKDTSGPWLFTGFTPVTNAGTVNVELSAGNITDFAGNTYSETSWTFNLESIPELIFQDSFDYPNGFDLAEADSWEVTGGNPLSGNVDVINGDSDGDNGRSSLEFPGIPASSGGRLQFDIVGEGSTQLTHFLPTRIVGEDISLYVSFLYKPTGVGPISYWQYFIAAPVDLDNRQRGRIDGHNTIEPNDTHLFQARFRNAVTGQNENGDGRQDDSTIFVVGRLTINSGGFDNDTWDMWISPDPTAAEPASTLSAAGLQGEDINPAAGVFGLEYRLRPTTTNNNHTGQFQYDELRIGTTWSAVTSGMFTPVQSWELF